MELLQYLIDIVMHLDKHLNLLVDQYGTMSYLLLFLVIFCETGLVVTPFLPGDSLLFMIGALSAENVFQLGYIWPLLILASILGDNTNYHIGKYIGPKIFQRDDVRFLNKKHLQKTHEFYDKYGGITVIIARFAPILRTFSPFVAGIGRMRYITFLSYSILGGTAWVSLFVLGGYFFGNIPFVQNNFTVVIFAIIIISLMPSIIAVIKGRKGKAVTNEQCE
jgi:membrane-associated protein